MNQWYGYMHIHGPLHAKRFFDDKDLQEARESDFVEAVTGPFWAKDREHAIQIVEERLDT